MTHIDEAFKNAEDFFNRVAIDDERLVSAIPELLDVIKELYPIRNSRNKTRDYLESWRKTKLRLTRKHTLANGKDIEVDICDPDMTVHDLYTEWLFRYLYNLYKNKTEKTIGYAFALEVLTQVHNGRRGNIYVVELPNAHINDVLDAIESKSNNVISNYNKRETLKTVDKSHNFIDYIHHHNKPALMNKLHELLDEAKGKNVAITIAALIKLSFLVGYPSKAVLYNSMRNKFGEIGANSGLNSFLNSGNNKLTEMDIKPTLEILKKIE